MCVSGMCNRSIRASQTKMSHSVMISFTLLQDVLTEKESPHTRGNKISLLSRSNISSKLAYQEQVLLSLLPPTTEKHHFRLSTSLLNKSFVRSLFQNQPQMDLQAIQDRPELTSTNHLTYISHPSCQPPVNLMNQIILINKNRTRRSKRHFQIQDRKISLTTVASLKQVIMQLTISTRQQYLNSSKIDPKASRSDQKFKCN